MPKPLDPRFVLGAEVIKDYHTTHGQSIGELIHVGMILAKFQFRSSHYPTIVFFTDLHELENGFEIHTGDFHGTYTYIKNEPISSSP